MASFTYSHDTRKEGKAVTHVNTPKKLPHKYAACLSEQIVSKERHYLREITLTQNCFFTLWIIRDSVFLFASSVGLSTVSVLMKNFPNRERSSNPLD